MMKDTAATQTKTGIRNEARRDRLIAAAERLFSLAGFRGTTMEGIAAEAGVAKATIYAYFPDKDAAFQAVTARLAEHIAVTVEVTLQAAGTPREGVVAALVEKELIAFRLAHSSPHARELFESSDRLAGDIFAASDRRKLLAIQTALAEAGLADPEAAARLLIAAADGITAKAASAEALQYDLEHLLTAAIAGWPRVVAD